MPPYGPMPALSTALVRVPQIAADLLHCPSRQPCATAGRRPYKVRGIGIGLLPVYAWGAGAMKFGRREFLHLAAGAVATATAVPSMVRGQGQALKRHPARDRLEEALSRIADPKGEGARACLTVYTQVARDAADAADAPNTTPVDGERARGPGEYGCRGRQRPRSVHGRGTVRPARPPIVRSSTSILLFARLRVRQITSLLPRGLTHR